MDLFLKGTNFDVNKIILNKYSSEDNVKKEKTGLNIAVKKGNFDIVKYLLSKNNLDISFEYYNITKNALFYSVKIEIVELLLKREDCDVNFVNFTGKDDCIEYKKTTLNLAFENQNLQIIELTKLTSNDSLYSLSSRLITLTCSSPKSNLLNKIEASSPFSSKYLNKKSIISESLILFSFP